MALLTAEQAKSADKFLNALKGIHNWQDLDIDVAAQRIQRYVISLDRFCK